MPTRGRALINRNKIDSNRGPGDLYGGQFVLQPQSGCCLAAGQEQRSQGGQDRVVTGVSNTSQLQLQLCSFFASNSDQHLTPEPCPRGTCWPPTGETNDIRPLLSRKGQQHVLRIDVEPMSRRLVTASITICRLPEHFRFGCRSPAQWALQPGSHTGDGRGSSLPLDFSGCWSPSLHQASEEEYLGRRHTRWTAEDTLGTTPELYPGPEGHPELHLGP